MHAKIWPWAEKYATEVSIIYLYADQNYCLFQGKLDTRQPQRCIWVKYKPMKVGKGRKATHTQSSCSSNNYFKDSNFQNMSGKP